MVSKQAIGNNTNRREEERKMRQEKYNRGYLTIRFLAGISMVVFLLCQLCYAQEVKKGGTVVAAISANPSTLAPSMSYAISPIMVSYTMFNALVDYDMKGNMLPELAESWDFSSDGKTWTFRLRKGIKWHDGKDFSSADVAFTIKEVAEKFHPLGKQAFGPISKIETPDPNTVVFKFEKPFFPTSSYLSCWYSGILPKHLYENTDILKNPYNFKPVGTGPFMFEEFKQGSHLTVVRNPNYWRKDKPILDKIIFRVITDGVARVSALEKGEVDILAPYAMAISEMKVLEAKGFVVTPIYAHDGLLAMTLFNLRNQYLGNKNVRYAIAHATNLDEIAKKAYFGYGKIPVGPIPSSITWAFTNDVKKFEYDPAKANKLLDESGYKRDSKGIRFPLEFVYAPSRTDFDSTAKIIKAQLREVGIDIILKPLEYAATIDEVFKKKKFDLTYWSLTMGPDPAVGTARLYLTSQIGDLPFTNAMGYSNPEVDRLFQQASEATSREKAGQSFKSIQKLITNDFPVLWTLEVPYPMAHSAKLVGLPEGPYWTHHMENVGWKK
ncbi:MAG: ABC transporter substrate-binding protein [Deltaproteobacteria bacterium]|nr:ABC transporter substrate-binding protein [Deltaproteobacteria bacterium]